ncbi:cellulosome anchoring protein cohesin region [Methanofervidicoccus sp. A16]|uniref:cellulosome anchoring protein cohesin region n=1 Tax=Methanofervidicoccus sp. A16 TaxID=2607662 RepID=UPI00118D0E40|nr:cellulosome anchoring protein cohesin region [Methanofervidicoccus sp. A16]AXI25385.1 cellulosome anchoring protein cohesin region [Methanofervidicoccus sp. A16]
MKKIFPISILFVVLLLVEGVLASENIYLKVDMPKKIEIGKNFTIDVDVNLNRNISGFECKIDTPIYGAECIQFINATGNEKIKEKAGRFYLLDLKNNSVFIRFVLLDKPLNSDFHLITVKGRALKKGNLTIRFSAVASDENGNAIKISPVTYHLEIVGNSQDSSKKTEDNNVFSWIIEIISNILRMIFGG